MQLRKELFLLFAIQLILIMNNWLEEIAKGRLALVRFKDLQI